MVYAAARRCICRARVSSAGSSLFIRNWRMGCAHEGAAISSTATTATWTRTAGLEVGGLESATARWIAEVPGLSSEVSGPSSEVPGPSLTVPLLESSSWVFVSSAWALEPDLTSSGGVGTKIESESGEGLIDGMRRHWRATPEGIAWREELIRAKVSACVLSFLGTWRN